ncbi:hypothetical protein VQ453_002458 [Pseudomonas aeruginosa]|nr:hypothetical protein [Pseudomonas aeruginosa]EMD5193267.1 hypothetical protein [Pseudomonas aeruginosa]
MGEVFSELRELTGYTMSSDHEFDLSFISDGLRCGDMSATEFRGDKSIGLALMRLLEKKDDMDSDELFSDAWESETSVNVAVDDGVRYYDFGCNGTNVQFEDLPSVDKWFDSDWEYVERDGVFVQRNENSV